MSALSYDIFHVDPVTSVVPTQDESTYLVMTLDGHIRLMDAITGKLLNDFSGHAHTSYRCRACFGHGEATIVAGDENGAVWAWDLLDVRSPHPNLRARQSLTFFSYRPKLFNLIRRRRYTIRS
jgi:mitogen-activated protein kinase organizer 1